MVATPERIGNATSNDEEAPCGICSGTVTNESKAVTCDQCSRWFHQTCGKVSNHIYNKIEKAPKDKPHIWRCEQCKRSGKKRNNMEEVSAQTAQKQNTQNGLHESNPPSPQNEVHIKDKLDAALMQNEQLKKIIDILNDDRNKITEQLERSQKENRFLNDLLTEKTKMITDLTKNITYSTKNSNTNIVTKISQNEELPRRDPELTEARPEQCEVEAMIVGDSILKGVKQKVTNPKVEVVCMHGARIQNFSKFISLQQTLPPTVVVHVGSNNLHKAKTPNHVMRPLWLTIESAQKHFKNTIWVVHGILHRKDIPDKFVEEVNEALQFMCEQLKVVFRDPNSAITRRGYGRDGVHLNPVGDQQLVDFVMNDLGIETEEGQGEDNQCSTEVVILDETQK